MIIIVFAQNDLFISRNSQVISCLFISILFFFLGHPTTMSSENIACCLMCHTNFNSHDELFVHSCTGKSLSEALIFASTNPQYDDRLFIEFNT